MFRPLLLTIMILVLAQQAQAADYYWVGGSGDWSDISHWATTSGGATRHNTVPTANDNVFFDVFSFTGPNQIVNVNNQSIFCLDLNWNTARNTPTFSGPSGSILNIYGSMRLITNMVMDFKGSVNFLATTQGKIISTGTHRFREVIKFNGPGGEWTLQTPLLTDSTLIMNAGSFNANGRTMIAKRWFVNPTAPVTLNLGDNRITIFGSSYKSRINPQYDTAVIEFNRENLTIIPSASTIELNSGLKPLMRVTGIGNIALGRVFFSRSSGKGRLISEPGGTLTMTKLDLRTDNDVEGSADFDTLALAKGKNYRFEAGFTYRLKTMIALGECVAPIQIFSSTAGTQFTFESSSDSIKGNFVAIQDIKATGGAKFVLRNAVDLGNNSGWDIFTKANNNLYWVGGTGDWNDPAHWSFSSGGTGGACIPTAGENVFFDANSGNNFTVTVNVENAYCRDMSWVGALGLPSFNGTDEKALHIFGSLTFINDMRLEFEGDVYFEGAKSDNVITSAGRTFRRQFIVRGTGTWSLADSLSTLLDFVFIQGNFNTNNQMLFTRSVISQNPLNRTLTLGRSPWVLRRVDLQNYNTLVWEINPQSMVLDAGTSTIEFRNWYGVLRTTLSGQGPSLNYNQVWFLGGDGSMFTYNRNRQKADSIRCSASFYLYGRNTMEVLEMLRTSNVIQPSVNDTTTINEILVPDLCTGMVELRSSSPDQKTFLESTHALVVRRMMIKDIFHIGVGPAVANNSIDLGNNQGWTINEIAGRDLYWVGKGGNGDWFDPVNWSLTSGGPGGECIPTAKDNVFFDANSFNGPNQKVNNRNLHAYCRNMSWVGVTNNPVFYMWILNAFGSVDLPKPQIGAYCTNLSLRSNDKDLKLQTLGFQIGSLQIMGHGSWTLQDTLEAYSIIHSEGEFNSNGKPVNINYYSSAGYFENKPTLKMGSSYWRINNNGADFNYTASFGSNLTVDDGTSLLEFTNTSPFVHVTNDHTFYNVLFSNPQGTSTWRTEGEFNRIGRAPYIAKFNRLEFRNNGILYGKNVIDSLIFSAGKSYQLDAKLAQTVNEYFQVIGNNCNPIELLSTSQGTKAEVIMNGGKVLADFVQMRDQRGVGSTQFLAGANSTNISNSNENWIFDSPVDYVDEGILGKDVVLCKNNSLTLDANTFSAGEAYRWNDGSASATLNVNRAGTYFVAVTYNDGCILRDTVRVLPAADFTPNLSNDTTLCSDQNLVLDADLNLVGATYRWHDGSTAASIPVTQAGKYKVTIELSGCSVSDSTLVRIISPRGINLGPDTSICDGQFLLLDASKAGGTTYLWSDSTTGPNLRVSTAGLVWVEVNDGQCTARDSINISVLPALGLNLGRDTSFCEGGSFNLRSNLGNLTYRWQDGSSNSSFRASTAGVYWLEASGNGCTERDSVNLRMQALPRFELGPDTTLCDGIVFNLKAVVSTVGNATYRWSNGTTNANISVQSSGIYSVTATLNGCTFNDQRRFTFNPGPAFELGANRGLCEGESDSRSVAVNGGTYRWNTGATTPTIKITQTGLYYVDVTLNGCTKRDSVFYTFAPEPVFTLGRDTILCAGENINLNASTTNATYRWNNGNTTATRNLTQSEVVWADVTVNGCRKRDSIRVQFIDLPKGLLGRDTTLCEGLTKTYQFNVPGATLLWQDNSSANPYVVSTAGLYILRASSGRCSVNDSVQIAYKPYPKFSLGPDTTLCNNETLNLNPTVAGGVYRWNDGQATAAKMLSQTGTYWLEIDLNACVRRDSVKIVAVNLPQSLLRPDTTLCEGSTLRLNVQVPNTTTQWQDGSSNPAFVVNQAGLYWAQVEAGRCKVRDSISVTYNPLPRFNLGKDTVLCTGETLALGALTGFDQVRWSTGASTLSINVTSAGTYWAQVTQQNCRFSDSLKVTLNAIPTVNIGPDTLVCDDKPFVLQANGSGNAQLLWSDGSTGKSLAATLAGTYWVRASNGRCADTDSMTLSLRECVVFKTFTPNAFSPDGNSTNETFRPYLNENVRVTAYEIQVFDRWGSQAFRSTDINTGWDGFIRGQKAPQGVYIYWFRIEYVDDKGPGNALVRGEVTLMR